jgi:hypothetical protein
MMDDNDVIGRFHSVLVDEIRRRRPGYLDGPFTVAEIYQNLVPYGTHRDRIGVEMSGDYEAALLRLLAGEGGYLLLESDAALRELREELRSSNPNTGLYRDYAAVDVRLNPAMALWEFVASPAPSAAPDQPQAEVVPVTDLAPDGLPPRGAPGAPPPAEVSSAAASSAETCRWCRAELPQKANLNFCPFCGTDVHVVPCRACGAELDPEWRFCISCGTEVSA